MSIRYPSRSGVAISPYELGFERPPAYGSEQTEGLSSVHHAQFERAAYDGARFKHVFRNLVTNVYPLYTQDHYQLHDRYDPPVVPKDSKMIDVVEEYLTKHGVIHAIKERRTREVYQIQAAEWSVVRNDYRSRLWQTKKRNIIAPKISKQVLRSPAFLHGSIEEFTI